MNFFELNVMKPNTVSCGEFTSGMEEESGSTPMTVSVTIRRGMSVN
jgi:hypothetical protein